MFHIANCTEMPIAYKKRNDTPIRATSSKLPFMSNKLALRPVGSLHSNIKGYQGNSKKQQIQEIKY